MFQSDAVREAFRTLVEYTDGVRCGPPWKGPAEGALREAYRSVGLDQAVESAT